MERRLEKLQKVRREYQSVLLQQQFLEREFVVSPACERALRAVLPDLLTKSEHEGVSIAGVVSGLTAEEAATLNVLELKKGKLTPEETRDLQYLQAKELEPDISAASFLQRCLTCATLAGGGGIAGTLLVNFLANRFPAFKEAVKASLGVEDKAVAAQKEVQLRNLDTYARSVVEKLEQEKELCERQRGEEKSRYEKALREQKSRHEKALRECQGGLETARAEHDQDLKTARTQHALALENQQKQHADELKSVKLQNEQALREEKANYEQRIADLQKTHKDAIQTREQQHERLAKLLEQATQDEKVAHEKCKQDLTQVRTRITSLEVELAQEKERREAEKGKHESTRDQLRTEKLAVTACEREKETLNEQLSALRLSRASETSVDQMSTLLAQKATLETKLAETEGLLRDAQAALSVTKADLAATVRGKSELETVLASRAATLQQYEQSAYIKEAEIVALRQTTLQQHVVQMQKDELNRQAVVEATEQAEQCESKRQELEAAKAQYENERQETATMLENLFPSAAERKQMGTAAQALKQAGYTVSELATEVPNWKATLNRIAAAPGAEASISALLQQAENLLQDALAKYPDEEAKTAEPYLPSLLSRWNRIADVFGSKPLTPQAVREYVEEVRNHYANLIEDLCIQVPKQSQQRCCAMLPDRQAEACRARVASTPETKSTRRQREEQPAQAELKPPAPPKKTKGRLVQAAKRKGAEEEAEETEEEEEEGKETVVVSSTGVTGRRRGPHATRQKHESG